MYKILSQYYEQIFPLSDYQKKFLTKHLGDNNKILDIGVATGSITQYLLDIEEREIVKVDISTDMLVESRKQNGKSHTVDILDMQDHFSNQVFDAIICLGNTLVHLQDLEEIEEVLSQSYALLNVGGKMIIQIGNMEKYTKKSYSQLPIISNEHIRFERSYLHKDGRVFFQSRLMDKDTNEEFQKEIELLNVDINDIIRILEKVGFSISHKFGNYKEEVYTDKSFHFIVIANKK